MDCIDRPLEDLPECWSDPMELYGEAMLDSPSTDQWTEIGKMARDPDYQCDIRLDRLYPW